MAISTKVVISYGQSVEFIQVLIGIPVEYKACHLLAHTGKEGIIFRTAEGFRIWLQSHDFYVHHGMGFQKAASIRYLSGGRLLCRNAAVNLTQMTMWETGSLCGLVACRQVTLHPRNIINDRIGFGQQFDDMVNGSIRGLTFSQVVKCECCAIKAHVLPPVYVGLILIL